MFPETGFISCFLLNWSFSLGIRISLHGLGSSVLPTPSPLGKGKHTPSGFHLKPLRLQSAIQLPDSFLGTPAPHFILLTAFSAPTEFWAPARSNSQLEPSPHSSIPTFYR